MSNDIFEQICHFIEEQRWKYPFALDRTTNIEKDLGITGDEAVEFILAFGKKFNVDVSNFMAAEYFESEGDRLLPTIIRFFTGQKKTKNKELILGDLERAVMAGKLDDTIIESAKAPD
jgi:acyl carrier protein